MTEYQLNVNKSAVVEEEKEENDNTYSTALLINRGNFKYETTSYRYVILFFFFFFTVTISMIQTSLTPVAVNLAIAYQIENIEVTFTSIVFSITYIPMTFVAIAMFRDMKPSLVFRIACVNAIFGGWIRCISAKTGSFDVILVGFCIISLSYPIMLSAVTLVCNAWLSDKERTMWIQLCGLSVPIGSILSFIFAGVMFIGKDYQTDTNKLMIIQNIMLTVFGGGLFIFVRDQPAKPPSSVAMQKVVRQSMLVVISEAFKERSYVILVAIFAMLDGAFVSFATVLSLFFSFYNVPGEKPVYNTGVVSAYGGVTAIFGVAASMACAVVLQKKQKFLIALRIICIMTVINACIAFITLPSGNIYIVGINLVSLGIFLVPVIPVSMNFASELTFPIAPTTTNGLLLMFGQGFGAIFGLIGTPLTKLNPLYMLGLYVVMALISSILTLFMQENLKKLAFTRQKPIETEVLDQSEKGSNDGEGTGAE